MVIGDLGKIVEGRDVCELFFGSRKIVKILVSFFLGGHVLHQIMSRLNSLS